MTWLNNGTTIHMIEALDGSWTVGPIGPIQAGVRTFDTPGTYTYTCKEHPWARAQLIVVPQ